VEFDFTPLWAEVLKISPTLRQPQLAEFTGLSVSALNRAVNRLQNFSLQDYRLVERKIEACREIQKRAGVPVNFKDVHTVKEMIAAYEDELRNPPPGPLQKTDWDLLASVMAGEDLSRLGISPAELLKRLEETSRRFDGLIDSIRSRNDDKKTLIKIVNDELEAKRNK